MKLFSLTSRQPHLADWLLLGPIWRQYLGAIMAGLLISLMLLALVEWQHSQRLHSLQLRIDDTRQQLDAFSRSSQLHKSYLKRTTELPISTAMQLADDAINSSGGHLIRVEQSRADDRSFRIIARMNTAQLYRWVEVMLDNHNLLLDSFSLTVENQSRLVRATYRVK